MFEKGDYLKVIAMAEKEKRRGTIVKYQGSVQKAFTKVPIGAIKDKNLSDAGFRLYTLLLLLQYEGAQKPIEPEGGVLYAQATLARIINMSSATFKRTLLSLEKAGYCRRRLINNTLTELTVIVKPSLSEQAAEIMLANYEEAPEMTRAVLDDITTLDF